jgi:hypothetical protein
MKLTKKHFRKDENSPVCLIVFLFVAQKLLLANYKKIKR